MWVILVSILIMMIIVLIIKVFLSNADEIPNSSLLPLNRRKLSHQSYLNTANIPVQQPSYTSGRLLWIEELFEQPDVVTFYHLREHYRFGFNPQGRMHRCICLCIIPFVLVFRVLLFVVECIGYVFFHILIRLFFETLIRLIWFLIQLPFRVIGHLLDGL